MLDVFGYWLANRPQAPNITLNVAFIPMLNRYLATILCACVLSREGTEAITGISVAEKVFDGVFHSPFHQNMADFGYWL